MTVVQKHLTCENQPKKQNSHETSMNRSLQIHCQQLIFKHSRIMEKYEVCFGIEVHIHKPRILYTYIKMAFHLRKYLENSASYKIIYILKLLYKIDGKLQRKLLLLSCACFISLLVSTVYAVHQDCGFYSKAKGCQGPLLKRNRSKMTWSRYVVGGMLILGLVGSCDGNEPNRFLMQNVI